MMSEQKADELIAAINALTAAVTNAARIEETAEKALVDMDAMGDKVEELGEQLAVLAEVIREERDGGAGA